MYTDLETIRIDCSYTSNKVYNRLSHDDVLDRVARLIDK